MGTNDTPMPTFPPSHMRDDVVDPGRDSLRAVDAVGFVNWDIKRDVLHWDRDAEERFGTPRGSMKTFEQWAAFVHPDDVARIRRDLDEVVAKRHSRLAYHYRFRRPDGEVRIFEGESLCWFDESGALSRLMGVVLDITQNEAGRNALTKSEARLRSIMETVPDALIVIDARGTIRDFNAAAERMFGYAAEMVLGTNIARLMPASMQEAHHAAMGRYLRTGERRVIGLTRALIGCRADGEEFPLELNVGEVIVGNERLFTGFIRDISSRVEAERRLGALRAQYLRTARLTAMGTVAAGLAHELNQPLAASANFVAAAKLSAEAGVPVEHLTDLLEQAQKQIVLAGEIIRRLRGFLTTGEQRSERLELAGLVEEAAALALPGRERQDVALQFVPGDDAPLVLADRVQLMQVMVNLIRNGAAAMGDAKERQLVIDAELDGDFVRISVIDHGPGFDTALVGTVDQPVISTKGSEGMGLGLSICRRIIESWNGVLRISNMERGGGCVTFTVPAA